MGKTVAAFMLLSVFLPVKHARKQKSGSLAVCRMIVELGKAG
jgi:hypothetical protein